MDIQKSADAGKTAFKEEDIDRAYANVMKTIKTDESPGRRFGALLCLIDMYNDNKMQSRRREVLDAIIECATKDKDSKTSGFALRFIDEEL